MIAGIGYHRIRTNIERKFRNMPGIPYKPIETKFDVEPMFE